jgi:hypothetical protein
MEAIWNFWCAHGWTIVLITWGVIRHKRQDYIKYTLELQIKHLKEYDLRYNTKYNDDKYDLVKRIELERYTSNLSQRISILETKLEERTEYGYQ